MVSGAALLLGLFLLGAAPEAPAVVGLPAARTGGGMALDEALAKRRSVRQLSPDASLTTAQLAQLCWAAHGVVDAKGHRTAPSARATYPLELFVLASRVEGVAPGLYRYQPDGHRLERLAAGDLRDRLVDEAIGQNWIKNAPAVFVVAWNPKRSTSLGARAERLAMIETGLVAENVLLEVVSLGLASTFVGGFDPAKARAVLGLAEGLEPTAILPVGKPQQARPAP